MSRPTVKTAPLSDMETGPSFRAERMFLPDRAIYTNCGEPARYPIEEASWVWACVSDEQSAQVVRFFRNVHFDGGKLLVHLSADQRYEFRLNGCLLGDGPESGSPAFWPFSSYRLELEPGDYRFEVLAWWLGEHAPLAHETHRPGFIFKAEGELDSELTTGRARWQAEELGGYYFDESRRLPGAHYVGAGLVLDAAARRQMTSEVDVKVVEEALVANDFGRMRMAWELTPAMLPDQTRKLLDPPVARAMLRRWIEDESFQPEWENPDGGTDFNTWGAGGFGVDADSELTLLLDFEQIVCARPCLDLRGGREARIDISWAESLITESWMQSNNLIQLKGLRSQIAGKRFVGFGDYFMPSGEDGTALEGLWWRSGRYVLVRIKTAEEPLYIDQLSFESTGYPLREQARLESPDPDVSAIADICRRSLVASAHEFFADSPAYEQLMYCGDARIQALCHYTMGQDDRLCRRAIRLFDRSRLAGRGLVTSRYPSRRIQIIPGYSLLWIGMNYDYLLWRGDAEFVQANIPGMRSVLDIFDSFRGDEGLPCGLPGWRFMDWIPSWKNGTPPMAGGYDLHLSLLYLISLQQAVRIEQCLGSLERAHEFSGRAGAVSAAVKRLFWHADEELFRCDASRDVHAQALAVIAGLFDDKDVARKALGREDLAGTSLYFTHYVMEAWRLLDREDFLPLLEPWRKMLALGLSTTPECEEPARSDCHAWSAHPLFHFYATVAGVRPAGPGFSAVEVAPRPGPLTHLKVEMPWKAGSIGMDAMFSAGTVQATLVLPDGLNGCFCWKGRRQPLMPGHNYISL